VSDVKVPPKRNFGGYNLGWTKLLKESSKNKTLRHGLCLKDLWSKYWTNRPPTAARTSPWKEIGHNVHAGIDLRDLAKKPPSIQSCPETIFSCIDTTHRALAERVLHNRLISTRRCGCYGSLSRWWDRGPGC
jgi:hypothetical protein